MSNIYLEHAVNIQPSLPSVGDCTDSNISTSSCWISKPFLDILREHIIPLLQQPAAGERGEQRDASGVVVPESEQQMFADECLGSSREAFKARVARRTLASVALVCLDWANAHRQAVHTDTKAQLWDATQVVSLERYLRLRPRVLDLSLCSPQSDPGDVPGMMSAIGQLLYGTGLHTEGRQKTAEDGNRVDHGDGDSARGPASGSGGTSTAGCTAARCPGGGTAQATGDGFGTACNPHAGCETQGVDVECAGGSGCDLGGSNSKASGHTAPGAPPGGVSNEHLWCGSALPRSLQVLKAEGAAAVPLLLLAASELPHLVSLSMEVLPASWTYQKGALPWPQHAEERVAQLLARHGSDKMEPELQLMPDCALHKLMYGTAVFDRFKSYWLSFERALAALLQLRGSSLEELALEAPARSVGRNVAGILSAQHPTHLSALRLRKFGLKRAPHTEPRLPLARAGLLLAGPLRQMAAVASSHAKGAAPVASAGRHSPRPLGPFAHKQTANNPASQRQDAWRSGDMLAAIKHPGEERPLQGETWQQHQHHQHQHQYQHQHQHQFPLELGLGSGPTASGDTQVRRTALPPLAPTLSVGRHPAELLGLTRLELLSCGVEPMEAEVLEGLSGLLVLSLRDSCMTWTDRPPDLRALSRLTRLDLRRSDWLAADGAPWEEPLWLPHGLESLDLVGFSSLTSADLSRVTRLTSLAELGDITLRPHPGGGDEDEDDDDEGGAERDEEEARSTFRPHRAPQPKLLVPPYSGLSGLTCSINFRNYLRREPRGGAAFQGRRPFSHSDTETESDTESGTESTGGSSTSGSGRGRERQGYPDGGSLGGRGLVAKAPWRRPNAHRTGGGGGGRCGQDSSSSDSDSIGRGHGGRRRAREAGGRHGRAARQPWQRDNHSGAAGVLATSSTNTVSGGGSPGGGAWSLGTRSTATTGYRGSLGGGAPGGPSRGSPQGLLATGAQALLVSPGVRSPPLVSLTLCSVLPQHMSDVIPELPLLTRLVFAKGATEGALDEDDGPDSEETGFLVLRAGELPRLRELELCVGLVGYGQLVLSPATSLTRLVLDDVEYVDVRYMELPSSLQHLAITALYGMPELYHLHEGPANPANMAAVIARAAGGLLRRRAAEAAAAEGRAAGAGHGGGGRNLSSEDGASDEESSDDGGWLDGAQDDELLLNMTSTEGMTRSLEAEVARQLLRRILPPLRQLRFLHLNWDLLCHARTDVGPLHAAAGALARGPHAPARAGRHRRSSTGSSSASGDGEVTGRPEVGGVDVARPSTAPSGWLFPELPDLEEMSIPWMSELQDGDLVRLCSSCPALQVVSFGSGSCQAVRFADGSWIRRLAGG